MQSHLPWGAVEHRVRGGANLTILLPFYSQNSADDSFAETAICRCRGRRRFVATVAVCSMTPRVVVLLVKETAVLSHVLRTLLGQLHRAVHILIMHRTSSRLNERSTSSLPTSTK